MAIKEKPIKKGKLADIVVERLNAKIRFGELKSGDRLPTERTLAEDMGVSRTVIREAIRKMVDKGVFEIHGGVGYVRQLSFEEIIANITESIIPDEQFILEIMEVRMILEKYIVEKATQNIDVEGIETIQESIDNMERRLEEGQIDYEEERAFHRGLAEATGNSALKSIYVLCEELLNSTRHKSLAAAKEMGITITAVKEHQEILNAIKSRNSEEAVRLMQHHVRYANENLERSYKKGKES